MFCILPIELARYIDNMDYTTTSRAHSISISIEYARFKIPQNSTRCLDWVKDVTNGGVISTLHKA